MSTRLLPRVVAHTHPPRYRLHKYWSRKPYNVVQAFVAALVFFFSVYVVRCAALVVLAACDCGRVRRSSTRHR